MPFISIIMVVTTDPYLGSQSLLLGQCTYQQECVIAGSSLYALVIIHYSVNVYDLSLAP